MCAVHCRVAALLRTLTLPAAWQNVDATTNVGMMCLAILLDPFCLKIKGVGKNKE